MLIPSILSPLVFLGFRSSDISNVNLNVPPKVSHITFALLYSMSIIYLYTHKVRPLPYFIIITILYVVILADIYYLPDIHTYTILGKIIFSFLNLSWGVNLKYPLFIGDKDVLSHLSNMQLFSTERSLSAISGNYQDFPLWYIFSTMTADILQWDISDYSIGFILSGIISLAGIFMGYSLVLRITGNQKVAILGVVFLTLHQQFLYYTMYSIPRSVTSIFFIYLLFLCIFYNLRSLILFSIISSATILYHAASAPFIILIFSFIFGLYYIANRDVAFFPLIAFPIVTMSYWLFNSEHIVTVVSSSFLSVFTAGSDSGSSGQLFQEPWVELINYSHLTAYILLVLLSGIIVSKTLSDENNETITNITHSQLLIIASVLLIPVAFPGLSRAFSPGNFNLGRISHYLPIIVSFSAAISANFIIQRINKKTIRSLFLIIFVLVTFFAISNGFVAADNPTIERTSYTYYLNENEIRSYDHYNSYSNKEVGADEISCRYMQDLEGYVGCNQMQLTNNGNVITTQSMNIIRTGEAKKKPLQVRSNQGDSLVYTKFNTQQRDEQNVVYMNGDVEIWSESVYNTNTTLS
ncbi:hypothetical protein C492_14991 [Natronococcus jeotgali DSM 18795]|uniref:Glycosyltransferase RgtA/B/C/D-like domain-containing protein n=2 Tax=Natronococcus jeotgali TaxID=413812 RepID=L9X725_9EURY|nr:hypothetical protein C492_14991 [Natronococcus jeotgali DSM 18795]